MLRPLKVTLPPGNEKDCWRVPVTAGRPRRVRFLLLIRHPSSRCCGTSAPGIHVNTQAGEGPWKPPIPSEPRVDRLGLKREDSEDRLVHFPERLVVDERGERLQAESVLALGQLALLAEVALAEYVE